jgi:acetyl esterase
VAISSGAALQWIAAHGAELDIDTNRIAVAGDSAGGALAATTARKAALANGPRLLLQALIYPVTDSSLKTASWEELAENPVIPRNNAAQAWSMYVPNPNDRQNPDASPLFATDLSGVAPALVIVAEGDPLRDEVLAYAQQLKNAGVPVKESLYEGMPHGFFQLGGYIDEGKAAIAEVAAALNATFTKK